MSLRIRPVTEEDAAAIVTLLNPIIEAERYSIMTEPVTAAEQRAFIRALPERSIYHAAVSGDRGRIVGVQDVLPASDERALLHVGNISTFVCLQWHRKGVGRSLWRATLPRARERGFRKLLATIREENVPAIRFYQSGGFQLVGTLRDHALVGDRYVNEVLMERVDP